MSIGFGQECSICCWYRRGRCVWRQDVSAIACKSAFDAGVTEVRSSLHLRKTGLAQTINSME